jgi:hypothetical protein
MKNKKNVSLVALIILSGCAEIKEFPKDFKRDFIGNYRSCTNYNFTYYNARTKN